MVSENRLTKKKTKEIIDDYFHVTLLMCATNFYADKFFRVSREEAGLDYEFGFSPRMERKRTKMLHMDHGYTFCKIFYMQIASILEASYFCLQKYISKDHSLYNFFQKKECKAEVWEKISQEVKGLRYLDLAHLVALSANVFKHNNGTLMKNQQGDYVMSSKYLVDLINKKLSKDDDSKFKNVLEGYGLEHLNIAYYNMNIKFGEIYLNSYVRITCALFILINDIIYLYDSDEDQRIDSIEEAFSILNDFEMHPIAEEALRKIGDETGAFILKRPT